jgi:rSAM/selenodomain-associated transferase 1
MGLAQLAVFVRPPVAGTTKTRLAEFLGDRNAAELYEAFVEDTLRACKRIRDLGRVDLALWTADAVDDRVRAWSEQLGASIHGQPNGDLGVRLSAAFEQGLSQYERVVVLGSDAPTLPVGLIVAAFDSLAHSAMTLGPTRDGGYYAIGARRPARPSFDGVRWSSATTFEDTKTANAALFPAVTSPWYDIDEPSDLLLLRAHLSADPAAAPATARWLQKHDAVSQR